MARVKVCWHVAVYEHAMWHMPMHVCEYGCVCAYMCARVISEIKHLIKDFR